MTIRQSVFLSLARPLRKLPNFRGKVRTLLAAYKALGLESQHFPLETTLACPAKSKFRLDLHSMHERMAFLMDEYESDTLEFLVKLHKDRGAFVDVGANIGLISIPFAKVTGSAASECSVYAVEAVASNVLALKENIALNGLDTRVSVVPYGVGDVAKTVDIQVEHDLAEGQGTGTANILADGSDYECERIQLTITTLDLLFADGVIPNNIDLMKIDIDGYDLFAMQGASTLLTETRPIIFGEFMAHCLNWHGHSVTDVVEFMRNLGYTTFMRRFPDWKFTAKIDPTAFVQDLLIVPRERIDECSWCIDPE